MLKCIWIRGNAPNSFNTCLNFLHTDKYKYFEGYNVMIIDYPGYVLSDGKPSNKTMFDSALKVYDYDYLQNRLEYFKIDLES